MPNDVIFPPTAFTSKYSTLANKLINRARIIANGKYIEGDGQWDTGAEGTCVSHEVVKTLGLIPIGKIKVITPSGDKNVDRYMAEVLLPNNVLVNDVIVNDSEIGSQGIIALIGMDIIQLGDFSVSNFNNKTFFSFRIPSKKHVNYVDDIHLEQRIGKRHGKGKKKKRK